MNETYDEVKSTEMGESLVEWTKEEKENSAAKYGCSILVEKATLDQVKDSSWPNDARLIRYTVDGVQHPKAIFSLWTESERNAINIYEVEMDTSKKKDEKWYINTDITYSFDGSKVTGSYGDATAKKHADTKWTQ